LQLQIRRPAIPVPSASPEAEKRARRDGNPGRSGRAPEEAGRAKMTLCRHRQGSALRLRSVRIKAAQLLVQRPVMN
jgi:hypothetical protein